MENNSVSSRIMKGGIIAGLLYYTPLVFARRT